MYRSARSIHLASSANAAEAAASPACFNIRLCSITIQIKHDAESLKDEEIVHHKFLKTIIIIIYKKLL